MPKTPATLAELRKAAGLTQMALAAKIGTTPARVSGWEGRGVEPSLKYLAPLAGALGVSLEQLVAALEASRPEARP
jgi:transcriptional regulator with XRE-family HTH domain